MDALSELEEVKAEIVAVNGQLWVLMNTALLTCNRFVFVISLCTGWPNQRIELATLRIGWPDRSVELGEDYHERCSKLYYCRCVIFMNLKSTFFCDFLKDKIKDKRSKLFLLALGFDYFVFSVERGNMPQHLSCRMFLICSFSTSRC
jgi:hypothetical protein